jgi:hypothetical protein
MKKLKFISLGLLLTMGLTTTVFTACGDDPDAGDSNNPDNNLASINIQGTKALFISSSNAGNKLYGVKSSTLRSTGEDEIFEIKYINSSGEEIQKSNPEYIYNLKDFIVLAFGDQYSFQETYLVKKSDGKVFAIPSEYMPHTVGNKYTYLHQYLNTVDKIQEDGYNNMYYTTYPSSSHKKTLYKVSLSSPSSLQFQEVSAVNDDVGGFCVDKNGNIHYGYYDSNTQSYKYRYRKSEGNFINTTFPQGQRYNCIWVGTDGQMYGAEMSSGGISYSDFGKIQDGVFGVTKQINLNLNGWVTGNSFNVKGKLFSTFYAQNPNKIFNLSNETEYAEISCPVMANYILNDDLYNFDKATFVLTLIDVSNGGTSVVFDLDETKLGNYDIDKIINVAQDGITFSAVDLNNGQYIIAKIFTDSTVEVQTSISGLVTTVMSLN